jgi:hypothetical protein
VEALADSVIRYVIRGACSSTAPSAVIMVSPSDIGHWEHEGAGRPPTARPFDFPGWVASGSVGVVLPAGSRS